MFCPNCFYGKHAVLARFFKKSNKDWCNIDSWINPLLLIGRKRTLNEEDLYRPTPKEETKYLTDQLEK